MQCSVYSYIVANWCKKADTKLPRYDCVKVHRTNELHLRKKIPD